VRKTNFLFFFSILFISIPLFALDIATRDLPFYYVAGGTFEVSIQVNTDPHNLPKGVIITETLPYGWTIVSSSPDYKKFDSTTNSYKWLQFSSAGVSSFTITYTVSVPSDAAGTYEFTGTIYTTTSGELLINGDTTIEERGGDINGDGVIDITDVILCLRQAVGLDPPEPALSDINGDGEVDISDVILILRIAVGLD